MSAVEPGESKVDFAYRAIREMIVGGLFGPGDRLVIDRLAVELGLSSVPVREGIRRLEAEGFAEFQRNAGARVVGINLTAFLESIEVLEHLEAQATALSVPHLKAADLREAQRWHRAMTKQVHGGDVDDPATFSQSNHRLHECLYRRCPNARLLELVEAEWDRVRATRRSTFFYAPDRAAQSVAEHQELLAAVSQAADGSVVDGLVRAHRQAARLAMGERLRGHSDAGAGSSSSVVETGNPEEECA